MINVAALLFQLFMTTPQIPQRTIGMSLACVSGTARDIHILGRHIFLCVNLDSGEILGALLKRSGVIACDVSGMINATGCFSLSLCGQTQNGCL